MRVEIPRRQHIAISYTILLMLLGAILLFTVEFAASARLGFFNRVASLRDVYARSAAVIGALESRRETAQQQQSAASDATYFEGETPALAAAELQNRIKQIVEAEGALLVSSAFRESREALPLTPITVAVRIRCSVAALQQVLFELESHEQVVFFDRLSIQSRHRPGRALRDENEELDADFEVTGYLNRPVGP